MRELPGLAWCGAVAIAIAAIAALVSPVAALCAAIVAVPILPGSLRRANIVGVAIALRAFLPDLPNPVDLAFLREALGAPLVAAIPEPDASIAVGALLGGKADLPQEVRDAFARTGTTHLLAASGFNITLVAGALSAALRPAGARVVALGTIVAAVAMSLAAGMAPSIVRAALMSISASAAVLVGRPASAIGALGAAVVALLMVSPSAVTDVGFLLSITATGGLLYLAAPLERRFPGPAWLRGQLSSTCAATFASLPISAEVFGRISLISPLANLAVAPLVAPLMAISGIAMGAGALAAPLAFVPEWLAYVLARLLRGIVEIAASFPAASVSLPHAGVGVVAVYGVGLIAARAPRLRRPLVVGLLIGAFAAIGMASAASARPSERIVALDVGQGDSFLLDAEGVTVLIDAGPDPARTLRSLTGALRPGTTRLDIVALTHSHADHEAGFTAILDKYAVGLALEPVGLEMNPAAASWHDALERHAVPVRALSRGARVRLGEVTLDALSPVGDPLDPLPNLVLRARVGRLTGLFLGDASERGQEDLLLHPDELRSLVYTPPHHGAATTHADALVAAAAPSVALISVGAGNRYGHPTPQTLRALAHVPTLRTDRDGTLEIFPDGDILRCATRSTALPHPWDGWLSRPPPCA